VNVEQTVRRLRGVFQAKRVYADAVERDGVTVIPAATIFGGGGAGGGVNAQGDDGGGTGFGIISRPAGAWVISDEGAEWKPAADKDLELASLAAKLIFGLLAVIWLSRRRG
jgi:uncharacterized spore protein YtfJ